MPSQPTIVGGGPLTPVRLRVTEHATELLPSAKYLTPEWHALRRTAVSASEAAVVADVSPWTSRFDLWWSKKLSTEPAASTPDTTRGHRLEPLVLQDYADAHPEFYIDRVGLCANVHRPWQTCTPDALAYETEPTQESPHPEPVAVVEAKTSATAEGWGPAGSDEIPVHYRAQVQWQMDTLGLTVAHVAVWIGYSFRCYVIDYHPDDVAALRAAARDFLTSIERDEPPPVDAHTATTRRLKSLHPNVDNSAVEVPASIVRQYRLAKRLRDSAQARVTLAENRLRDRMGEHKIAVVNNEKVASRSVAHIRARTQTVAAHTRDTIRFTKE